LQLRGGTKEPPEIGGVSKRGGTRFMRREGKKMVRFMRTIVVQELKTEKEEGKKILIE